MKVKFVIPGTPKGKERPRITKFGVYTPKQTKAYEEYIKECYRQQCDVYFEDKSIYIDAIAYVEPLKQYRKAETKAALANEFHPTSKPDTDNIMKAVLDALNGIAFADDRYIYDLHIVKKFDVYPRIEVTIESDDTAISPKRNVKKKAETK